MVTEVIKLKILASAFLVFTPVEVSPERDGGGGTVRDILFAPGGKGAFSPRVVLESFVAALLHCLLLLAFFSCRGSFSVVDIRIERLHTALRICKSLIKQCISRSLKIKRKSVFCGILLALSVRQLLL